MFWSTLLSRRLSSIAKKMELGEVVCRLQKYAPQWLAESWDNIGLLVEPGPVHNVNKLLLTNDLTENVVNEAVDTRADMILSYHPPIFKPLKRLSQKSWKERIIMKCIENRIAVYSPHTCYDALSGGVNDWLVSPFGGSVAPLVTSVDQDVPTANDCRVSVVLSLDSVETFQQKILAVSNVTLHSRLLVNENKTCLVFHTSEKSLVEVVAIVKECDEVKQTMEIVKLTKPPKIGYGCGRMTVVDSPIPLSQCVDVVKSHLKLSHVQVGVADGHKMDSMVRRIAVCAGSGASVLSGVHADLFVTGEMSHHDVLDAVHAGTSVVLCGHSNTERGFLACLRTQLDSFMEGNVEVYLSTCDRDPLEIV